MLNHIPFLDHRKRSQTSQQSDVVVCAPLVSSSTSPTTSTLTSMPIDTPTASLHSAASAASIAIAQTPLPHQNLFGLDSQQHQQHPSTYSSQYSSSAGFHGGLVRRDSLDSDVSLNHGFDSLAFCSPLVSHRKASLASTLSNSHSYAFSHSYSNSHLDTLAASQGFVSPLPFHSTLNPFQQQQQLYMQTPQQQHQLDQWNIDYLCRPQINQQFIPLGSSVPQVSFLDMHQPIDQQSFFMQPQHLLPSSPSIAFDSVMSTNHDSATITVSESTQQQQQPISPPTSAVASRTNLFFNFFKSKQSPLQPKKPLSGVQEGDDQKTHTTQKDSLEHDATPPLPPSIPLPDVAPVASSQYPQLTSSSTNPFSPVTSTTSSIKEEYENENDDQGEEEDQDWKPNSTSPDPTNSANPTPTSSTSNNRRTKLKSVSAPNLRANDPTDTRPRDYVCATCLNRFLRRQDLNRHEVTHQKTKGFSCPLGCGTMFGRSDALTRHLRMKKCSGVV
ncbi:hypothetical protein BCR33DRAFT_714473 [Rhizoclosmatium globosum]|uniref:C2H2-type domain-containing protein n=1 Tax=Rhizoclosmatium globosum TaxID=329046 RepID=A0A1Y2CLZ7_9FUNG|nr:hypothetical protein BCR33DRAFT_714473 [Rhizoclosmatium globosum]|eukprot:ORY48023.1 hypothetical protein BCR33DRAFT_714473 [Rhizoclosmatium globosum]